MSEKLDRFVDLLRKIFELDKSDLDFGIYRIMNIRKGQIDEFLSKTLPEQVKKILESVADNKDEIRKKMAARKAQAVSFDVDVEKDKEYLSLKEQLLASADISALETDVYSSLYNFFNRYYDEGDFISKRRYKEGVYAIPYEGEEVKLYWANQDQYYIKTTENFKDYSFVSDGVTVHFMLVDATTEQNNNKENGKKRAFMLFTENDEQPGIKTFEKKNNEFIIRFVYDLSEEKQPAWDDKNYTAIKEYIVRNHDKLIPLITPSIPSTNDQISLIQKHLYNYVAKNTFDYFIHKDLGGFLNRELEFFIKNEIIHLDDIDTDKEEHVNKYLARARAIKKVGNIIINFLAQIENFQKRLWLKKKFVIRTDYCMTLDKIPEKYYEEIRGNKAQIQEWIDLYAIDEVSGNGGRDSTEKWTNLPSIDFLKANKYLVIDTKHFNPLFKEAVLSNIDNLDEVTDGVLVQSENFQALNFLREQYKGKIDCIYIDPPYNAQSSEILYKNTYKHSSWLSLMYDRILCGRALLTENFCHITAIDEVEQEILGQIISAIFHENKKVCLSIVHNPRGQQGKNVSYTHEFAYLVYPNDSQKYIADVKRTEIDSRTLRDSGTESDRTDAATCFYPFFVKDGKIIGVGKVPDDDFHPESGNVMREDGIMEIYPIDDNGNEKKWRYSVTSVHKIMDKLEVKNGRSSYQIIFNQDMGVMKSLWTGAKYDASEYGTKILQDILTVEGASQFTYPKSIYTVMESITIGVNDNSIVLDYFAGSATTGHAVINLNRSDKGKRKYILVEMGEYFNSVTKPRMQKVIYADDWKDGKPLSRDTGVSQIMKYFCLESYDDTLTNIEFSDNPQGKNLEYGDEYLINYMLDVETKGSLLNISRFKEPFDYRLKITERNEIKETSVDLVETFNYLLGLNVVRNGALRFYKAVKNDDNDYEGSVDLKEDKNGDFMFKQIKGYLNDGNRILIIWRNITDDLLESNNALDAYFQKNRPNAADRDFDVVYVNGDNNLENLRLDNERWKVKIIEKEFMDRMFAD